uniref:Uncharacterized protein n=1 Tax=viral metagenome TaxID=1070528 RepID=A0A6M3JGP8_9ZZZZ
MESCKFCGKGIPGEQIPGTWTETGWCNAECAFRFYTFTKPIRESQVDERNQAVDEVIMGYRLSICPEAGEPGLLPTKTRLVLEVIQGEIQVAWTDRGPVEILIAEHDPEEDAATIHLPKGKGDGPIVSPSILGVFEVKTDPAFVEETFRRAE